MQSEPALEAALRPMLAAVDRRVLHEAVAERLRELIVEGVLAPGAHLNERVLCALLAVSRTPLREAFRTLAGEGIVELQPNRGAVVAAMRREHAEQTVLKGTADYAEGVASGFERRDAVFLGR